MARAAGESSDSTGTGAPAVGRLHPGTLLVVVLGVFITGALTFAATRVHDDNEDRLLRQRVLEASSVINSAMPSVRLPVASAASIAEVTEGGPRALERFLPEITGEDGPFTYAAVFERGTTEPLETAGTDSRLVADGDEALAAMVEQAAEPGLMIVPMLDDVNPRLGYAFASADGQYVAYAEQRLPPNRRQVVRPETAFDDLDYALYVGTEETDENLLFASVEELPITGRRASESTEFGNTQLTLVMTPRESLGSNLLSNLWWMLVLAGVALTAGAAALTERLLRQRERAEGLAAQLAELYASQRTIAQELQQSLLPQELPDIPGLEIGARYEPGAADVEIGGDWYDVVRLEDNQVLVVVGDVSGHGLPAATIMASLRYAIRAYAAQGDPPSAILQKLRTLVDVSRDEHFATVWCGLIDVRTREITVANAGHPNALLVTPDGTRFVEADVGTPIGVPVTGEPGATTTRIPDDGTLLAFTDGLFERRGQTIDVGLAELREAARGDDVALDELLARLVADLVPDGANDDIALLGVRWRT